MEGSVLECLTERQKAERDEIHRSIDTNKDLL